MKFTTFHRAEHRILSNAITAAIKDIGAKFGVDLQVGGGQIGSSGGKVSINVAIQENAAGESPLKNEFERQAPHYGMVPSNFGETFRFKNHFYKIVSINSNAPRFPINAERVVDGKMFRFPEATVKSLLTKKAA